MEGQRASTSGVGPAFHNHLDNKINNAVTIPRVPLIPVNHRKPITNRSDRGWLAQGDFRNKRRPPENHESRPYPSTHDGLLLRGLLDGNQVFLYDRADYRFLRLHRGCFGEFIKQSSRGSDIRSTSGGGDGDEEDEVVFPPPLDAHPVAALNLYEAFFLAVECNSLEIWDGSTEKAVVIDKHNLMALFVDIDPTFPQFFAVYYHFRMLKYVAISGVKFGVDMALYEYGPSKTHSVYLVYVIIPGVRDPSIIMLDTLQRIANATKKDGLLVQVNSDHLSEENLSQNYSFTQMKITEVLVRRRERLFDQPVESVPAVMLPPYRRQKMVDVIRPGRLLCGRHTVLAALFQALMVGELGTQKEPQLGDVLDQSNTPGAAIRRAFFGMGALLRNFFSYASVPVEFSIQNKTGHDIEVLWPSREEELELEVVGGNLVEQGIAVRKVKDSTKMSGEESSRDYIKRVNRVLRPKSVVRYKFNTMKRGRLSCYIARKGETTGVRESCHWEAKASTKLQNAVVSVTNLGADGISWKKAKKQDFELLTFPEAAGRSFSEDCLASTARITEVNKTADEYGRKHPGSEKPKKNNPASELPNAAIPKLPMTLFPKPPI